MSRRARHDDSNHPLVAIHNVTDLSNEEIRTYCSQYDSRLQCNRKHDSRGHEYLLILFSSMDKATNFLHDRPHFIQHCRINASLVRDVVQGSNFIHVQIERGSKITEDELYEYVSSNFGRVWNCVMYADRGYAFVEFAETDDADRALASTYHKINGVTVRCRPRQTSARAQPPPAVTTASSTPSVHIGNFGSTEEEKVLLQFPQLQQISSYRNSYGQMYLRGVVDADARVQLLSRRAFCLNGRVLHIFSDNDDPCHEWETSFLVRPVPLRLSDYHLLEYFSQFGSIVNCYRQGGTDIYRLEYRDGTDLTELVEPGRTHWIKSVSLRVEPVPRELKTKRN